jgi:hypothetical protein
MGRAKTEMVEVLKALLVRLQSVEEKVDEFRQVGDRLDGLESEVATARIEASRGGEQLKSLLGDLIFDDKAPPDANGVPQYVRRANGPAANGGQTPPNGAPGGRAQTATVVEERTVQRAPDTEPAAPAPSPEQREQAAERTSSTGRRLLIAFVTVVALAAGAFGGGVAYEQRSSKGPPFVVPSSCRHAQVLGQKSAPLEASMSTEYAQVAAAAAGGHAVSNEQLVPADRALAKLAQNTGSIAAAASRCTEDLDSFARARADR